MHALPVLVPAGDSKQKGVRLRRLLLPFTGRTLRTVDTLQILRDKRTTGGAATHPAGAPRPVVNGQRPTVPGLRCLVQCCQKARRTRSDSQSLRQGALPIEGQPQTNKQPTGWATGRSASEQRRRGPNESAPSVRELVPPDTKQTNKRGSGPSGRGRRGRGYE